ncbi:MAG: malate synthase A, partial [Gaiellaceae bacterium]
AVAIYNLMEDAATAEISRSQTWQWLRHGRIERERVVALEDAELAEAGEGRWAEARTLFDEVALSEELTEFLTLPAYELID